MTDFPDVPAATTDRVFDTREGGGEISSLVRCFGLGGIAALFLGSGSSV